MNKSEILELLEKEPSWSLELRRGVRSSWWQMRNSETGDIKSVNGSSAKAAAKGLNITGRDLTTVSYSFRSNNESKP